MSILNHWKNHWNQKLILTAKVNAAVKSKEKKHFNSLSLHISEYNY